MVYNIALFHLCTFCKVAKAMKNTVRLLCVVTLCHHGTFIGRSVSFQGLKALCGCRFTHTLQHSLAKLCLVTVCIIAVLGDHSVSFQGLYVATHVRMLQYSVAKPPRGPILHPVGWRGVARGGGGPLCTPNTAPNIFLLPTPCHHGTVLVAGGLSLL